MALTDTINTETDISDNNNEDIDISDSSDLTLW
jgi:hypothetical protein